MPARRTRATAEGDLAKKMVWERRLIRKLNALNREIAREFSRTLAERGVVMGTAKIEAAYNRLLFDHRHTVSTTFANRLRHSMPKGYAITGAEEAEIASSLVEWNTVKSSQQARRIASTVSDGMHRSVALADAELAATIEPALITRAQRGRTAGTILKRGLNGRVGGIATLETQNAAEGAKLTEAEVLTGTEPTIRSGASGDTGVTKRWDSLGDSIVRPSHLTADSQEQPAQQPFDVGGAQLMFPGNDSLGAPLSELAGCRCSSDYDPTQIADIRQQIATPSEE